jgi:hypothetical protein
VPAGVPHLGGKLDPRSKQLRSVSPPPVLLFVARDQQYVDMPPRSFLKGLVPHEVIPRGSFWETGISLVGIEITRRLLKGNPPVSLLDRGLPVRFIRCGADLPCK